MIEIWQCMVGNSMLESGERRKTVRENRGRYLWLEKKETPKLNQDRQPLC